MDNSFAKAIITGSIVFIGFTLLTSLLNENIETFVDITKKQPKQYIEIEDVWANEFIMLRDEQRSKRRVNSTQ